MDEGWENAAEIEFFIVHSWVYYWATPETSSQGRSAKSVGKVQLALCAKGIAGFGSLPATGLSATGYAAR
jgi:hypothetical protein